MPKMTQESKYILMVEDDPKQVQLRRLQLRHSYIVQDVGTLAEAVLLLRDPHQIEYALIVLDLGLPDATDLESLQTIRPLTKAPIVVITGQTDDELGVHAVDCGADDYLLKTEASSIALKHRLDKVILQSELRQRLEEERALRMAASEQLALQQRAHTEQPLRTRDFAAFGALMTDYRIVFDEATLENEAKIAVAIKDIAERLAALDASPRDALDLHTRLLRGYEDRLSDRKFRELQQRNIVDLLMSLGTCYRTEAREGRQAKTELATKMDSMEAKITKLEGEVEVLRSIVWGVGEAGAERMRREQASESS